MDHTMMQYSDFLFKDSDALFVSADQINAKIEEILENQRQAEKEIQIINRYQKEFSEIHQKYNNLYGKKYGINQRKVKRHASWAELERIMHLVRAEEAQPRKSGFMGLGGWKKADYDIFTDKLNLIESGLEFFQEDWDCHFAAMTDELRNLFDIYDEYYQNDMDRYEKICKENIYAPPENTEIEELLLGNMVIPLPGERHIANLCAEHSYSFISGSSMHILVKLSLKKLISCYVQYKNEVQLEEIHAWIRNLNRQMISRIPKYHCELIYLDGLHNGGGLKELLNLQEIHEEYVPEIAQQLQGNARRLLKIGRDSESIHRELRNLEQYMGIITDMLQGCSSFAEYNAVQSKKIPYRLVVLECVDAYMDKILLQKLLNNGPRCGIFIIYLQDRRQLKEHADKSELFAGLLQMIYGDEKILLKQGEKEYEGILLTDRSDQTDFVNDIRAKLNIKHELDNSFEACFPDNYQWGQYTSTIKLENGNMEGKITIPYALDTKGNIVSIELGSADFAHGLISGGTGSGKSTMLHMIINSVVMNYRPEDVEIWLADYKQTEMSVYIADRPPHIKFIGIERNEEFSFSLIDLIYEEYESRSKIFVERGVRNIDAYKDKFGIYSLPRILIVIDEFHLMSQQVGENPYYSERLENILSEARTTGIACLFCDQAVSVGLRGLTAKGKMQMRMRLAMANDREEMGITLDARVSEEESALQTGEVRRKKIITRMNAEGENVKESILELDKVIYISDSCREQVAKKAVKLYGEGRVPVIVDGKKQVRLDWDAAEDYERKMEDGRETYYLHLGVPSNFDTCYAISLIRDYGQNIMCVHDSCDIQKLVLLNAIVSFLRMEKAKIYILADENDSLYLSVREELSIFQKKYFNISVFSDMEEVCSCILDLNDLLITRRKKPGKEAYLVIWLGLESMMREFQYYDALPKGQSGLTGSAVKMQKLQDELEKKMELLFDDVPGRKEQLCEESTLFDATDQVENLVKEGAKRGLFQFVFISNLLALKWLRALKLENFNYKMSGYLNRDNSIDYFGSSKFMGSMSEKKDNKSFVCYDGRKSRFFVPYLKPYL